KSPGPRPAAARTDRPGIRPPRRVPDAPRAHRRDRPPWACLLFPVRDGLPAEWREDGGGPPPAARPGWGAVYSRKAGGGQDERSVGGRGRDVAAVDAGFLGDRLGAAGVGQAEDEARRPVARAVEVDVAAVLPGQTPGGRQPQAAAAAGL